MRILILSFYYPPDLGAGSFRVKALIDALRAQGREGVEIDVLTTLPNRYSSHRKAASETEYEEGVRVRRIAIPPHRSGMADQAKAFFTFAWQVLGETRGKKYDVVFATSSRLMTAALGREVAGRTGALLYLDIRDLFVDTMSDVLSRSAVRNLLPFFRWVEKRTLQGAARINLVSEGFLPYATAVAPDHAFRCFTNGIDEEYLTEDFACSSTLSRSRPLLILYAGNIGEGQGLHSVIPAAARLLQGKANFRVIGDGGRREHLSKAVADLDVSNVELLPAIARRELSEHYRQADILFLHLNDHAAFRKVLPSKIFEYAATGKPILAGVAGYPSEFIRKNVAGAEVFQPCDADGLVDALERLQLGSALPDRAEFRQRYARVGIMQSMAQDVLALKPA